MRLLMSSDLCISSLKSILLIPFGRIEPSRFVLLHFLLQNGQPRFDTLLFRFLRRAQPLLLEKIEAGVKGICGGGANHGREKGLSRNRLIPPEVYVFRINRRQPTLYSLIPNGTRLQNAQIKRIRPEFHRQREIHTQYSTILSIPSPNMFHLFASVSLFAFASYLATAQTTLPPSSAAEKNTVDHAGILASLDDEAFAAGRTIYDTLCVNCHGADGITPPLPTARAFGAGDLKFGTDPYSMFQTLTNGNGLMGPQTWMTPEERYHVIHYIRETFMRPMRDDFKDIGPDYLATLPIAHAIATKPDAVERDFGRALASQLGRDISSVLTVQLNSQVSVSYNLHTMDHAGLWSGGFLDLSATQHYRERGGGVPEPDGAPIVGLQEWRWGHEGSLNYPTQGLLPRGPLPAHWMEYRGHYLHEDGIALSYSIDGREILEIPSAPTGFNAIEQTLEIGPGKPLLLSLGHIENASDSQSGALAANSRNVILGTKGEIQVLGAADSSNANLLGAFAAAIALGDTQGIEWIFDRDDRLILSIPEDREKRVLKVTRYADRGESMLLSFANYVRSQSHAFSSMEEPSARIRKLKTRWPEILKTSGRLGSNDKAYALDEFGLPPNDAGNPYGAWFRTSALAFFPDGRMVVSTHGGDIWIVSGIDGDLSNLQWKRHAAGLYEPFGLQVIDGLIYVTCKDRLTRLHDYNGDGEADFYESFSADDDVSTWFHAFNFDLQRDAGGNLYYAKAGQYTSYKLPGSIIKVSPDGKTHEVYATGLRTPNGMGMMPDGRPTVSDNQGNWMPASKVSIVEPDGFYGYVQTNGTKHWAPDGGLIDHTKVVGPDTFDQPIIWMPQEFDNSSGGQVWIDDERWGPLSGRLLHTSFGKGWLYYTMMQEVDGVSQAAIVKFDLDASTGIHRARVNPADGQVYAVGLNGWNGSGRLGLGQGGIARFRYTGAPDKLLTHVEVASDGIRLEFNFALAPEAASDLSRYDLTQWNYAWTKAYGSEQFSIENGTQAGRDQVKIEKAILGNRGRSVFLRIPDIQPVNQVELNLDLLGSDGGSFEEQAYLTINAVPGGQHPNMKELIAANAPMREELRKLTEARRQADREAKKKAAEAKATEK